MIHKLKNENCRLAYPGFGPISKGILFKELLPLIGEDS